MSAADDPTGTVRRSVTNWGFGFYTKYDQPEYCWLLSDAYCPMTDLNGSDAWLSNEQMDARNTRVVYTPMGDHEWAVACGLKSPVDCKCGHTRHNGPDPCSKCDCTSYYPNEEQIV